MPAALPFDRTTRLVARGLGISGGDLLAGLRPATPADLASVIALRNSERGPRQIVSAPVVVLPPLLAANG